MHVICTAGHVDHGKSTLIEALTGIHPDRLKEEREREMTIDLGFAWLTLPGGATVGVVDVPGHRDFIENMLAGVGSVDAALLVVAADEGVMPQTREHLAILDLLEIDAGVVALTKVDLVEDDEWLALVADEVAHTLLDTVLTGAPIVPVSVRSGQGLDELQQALADCLDRRPSRPDIGRPRLSIDRVFTISGFGTVVTGTLLGGSLYVGDEVTVLPADKRARIRGLQTHKAKIDCAVPGSRVAVNLTGVEVSDLRRGDVVVRPGTLTTTRIVDVRFRHLPEDHGTRPLKHNTEVKFFVGAAEVIATARGLSHRQLPPGEAGWLQLLLREAVAVDKSDRFILRRPSPPATIGGGIVVDPAPRRRHRLLDRAVLGRLETLLQGTPAEILLQAVESLGPGELRAAVAKARLDQAAVAAALAELAAAGQLIVLDDVWPEPSDLAATALVTSLAAWNQFKQRTVALVSEFHAAQPLRVGIPREELKSRLRLEPKVFNALVRRAVSENVVVESGATVRLPDHRVQFNPQQQRQVAALLAAFERNPYSPPSRKESVASVGEQVLAVLLDQGTLTPVSPEVLLLHETYEQMVAKVRAELESRGTLTVAEVRDLFGTSRKYALALMEHLDALGVTVRRGDERVLKGR